MVAIVRSRSPASSASMCCAKSASICCGLSLLLIDLTPFQTSLGEWMDEDLMDSLGGRSLGASLLGLLGAASTLTCAPESSQECCEPRAGRVMCHAVHDFGSGG